MSAVEPGVSGPYKGLAPFGDSELDALLFFGRERECEIVVANLIAARLTVLYGPSGVGKSSFLRAGVARALRALPEQPVVAVFAGWTEDPAAGLAAAVCEAAGVPATVTLGEALTATAGRDVYLILDQVEEYFLYHGGGQGAFEEELAAAVARPSRVNALLSLREDSLAKLDRFKGRIPNLFGNYLRLDRLDREAGRAAIVQPIERWNQLERTSISVEPVLVEAVLGDIEVGQIEHGHGGLGVVEGNGRPTEIEAPFLQLVMQRLWEAERAEHSEVLRAETLEALGGAERIVGAHLEQATEALTPEQREVATELSRYLVTPSGTKIAHTLPDLAAYVGAKESVLEPLAAELCANRILRSVEADGVVRYEIFHDVLAGAILAWRADFRTERAERVARGLLIGISLAVIALVVMASLAAYALVERSHARTRARVAKARALDAYGSAALSTDPVLGVLLASEAARRSPTQQAEDVLRHALLADRLLAVLPAGGPVVDVEYTVSSELAPGGDGLIGTASLDGVARIYDGKTYKLLAQLRHGAPLTGLRLTRQTVITAGKDGTARIWNLQRQLRVLRHGPAVVAVGVSASHDVVVTGGGRDVEVWRAGKRVSTLRLPTPVRDVAVAPADSYVLVRASDRLVRMVDVQSGKLVRTLDLGSRVDSIGLGRDRPVIAAGGANGVVRVWDSRSGRLIGALVGHTSAVLGVYPFGKRLLVSASADGTARIWDVRSGKPTQVLIGHANYVTSAGSDAAGAFVLTTSDDRTAKTWNVTNGRLVATLVGHRDAVLSGLFLPGSASRPRVLTASRDGTARVWDPGTADDLLPTERSGPRPPVVRASSPDGTTAVVSGKLVRLAGPAGTRTLRGHRDTVNSVAFSPDGKLFVTASRDHDAIVWDVETGEPVHVLNGHFGSVADARFSPDGRWIVTAGPYTAGLWEVGSGELVSLLRGPDPASRLSAAAFLQDSRTIVTSEQGGSVRSYDCAICGTIPELLRLADARLRATGRTLTPAERRRYIG